MTTMQGTKAEDAQAGIISLPRHIVWSTERLDLADPFQRKWYIRQVIEHGRSEDIAGLDLAEVASVLDDLNLSPHLHSLWTRFLDSRHVVR